MSINIVNQRYQLTLSISSVNQHYQSTLSINSINQHYQSTLSINSISQHYPSTVSINIVNQRYQWTVSINIINQQSQSKIIAVIKMVLIGIDPYPYINHKIVMALSSRCANHRPQKVAPSWAASRSKTSPRPKHAGIPKNSSIATSCYTALVKNCLARLKKKRMQSWLQTRHWETLRKLPANWERRNWQELLKRSNQQRHSSAWGSSPMR